MGQEPTYLSLLQGQFESERHTVNNDTRIKAIH